MDGGRERVERWGSCLSGGQLQPERPLPIQLSSPLLRSAKNKNRSAKNRSAKNRSANGNIPKTTVPSNR